MTGKKVYVPRSYHEKELQRALLQWFDPGKRKLVEEALTKAGRTDLIGCGPRCLIRPEGKKAAPAKSGKTRESGKKPGGRKR